jgi:hypothetical protein
MNVIKTTNSTVSLNIGGEARYFIAHRLTLKLGQGYGNLVYILFKLWSK